MSSVPRLANAVVAVLMFSAAHAGVAGAQTNLDSLTVSRAEAVERAIALLLDGGRYQEAIRKAASQMRSPFLVSNPVLEVESEGTPSPLSGREYTRKLSLDQEIDLRGHGAARRRVGAAAIVVAERDWTLRAQDIRASVDEAYGRWLLAEHRGQFLAPLVGRANELGVHAEAARRREIVTGFDVRVLKGDVAELESERLEARRELEQADAELRVWMGLPAGPALRLVDDLDPKPWRCDVEMLLPLARRSRADLARASAAESLATARLALERRLNLANPSVGISVGRERRTFESPPAGTIEDKQAFAGIRASFPLPLRRTSSVVGEAQVELARAQSERIRIELAMRQDLAAGCARLMRSEERQQLLQTAAGSAAADLRLTEAAYREGRIPLEQYLTVRERLVRIQREAIDAAAAVEDARTRLIRATGVSRDVLAATIRSTER